MRVALDATPLLGAVTGVGVFCRELLGGLGASADVDPLAFALTWRGRNDLQTLLPPGVSASTRPMAARPLRSAWLRGDRPTIEGWTGSIDVVHGTNFVVPPARSAAEIVTVHDLTAIHFPELCRPDVLEYPRLISRAIARGAWVHAVSDFVADEVRDFFPIDPDRVVTVHHGVRAGEPPGDRERGARLAGSERYVVAIGTIEPRKGLPTLVRAFDRVAADDPDLRLVLVGPNGWGTDALDQALTTLTHGSRIVRTGWACDTDRRDLLSGAAMLAYPSLYEGFGLPPLEAMAQRIPVVASSAGPLPEVLGDAALLVPPSQIDPWAEAMRAVCNDPSISQRLVEAGAARVARYSWPTAVSNMVEMYQHASG